MRVYLHCLEPCEYTKVFKLDKASPTSIQDLVQAFAEAYNLKHGHISLLDPEKATAQCNGKALLSPQIASRLPDRADIFIKAPPPLPAGHSIQLVSSAPQTNPVTVHPQEGRSQHAPSQAKAATSPPTRSSAQATAKGHAATTAPALADTQVSTATEVSPKHRPTPLQQQNQQQTELRTGKSMPRQAAAACMAVLAQAPGHLLATQQLCKLLLAAGRPAHALEAAQEAVRVHPEDMAMKLLLGDCQLALGNGAAALEAYNAAVGLGGEVRGGDRRVQQGAWTSRPHRLWNGFLVSTASCIMIAQHRRAAGLQHQLDLVRIILSELYEKGCMEA